MPAINDRIRVKAQEIIVGDSVNGATVTSVIVDIPSGMVYVYWGNQTDEDRQFTFFYNETVEVIRHEPFVNMTPTGSLPTSSPPPPPPPPDPDPDPEPSTGLPETGHGPKSGRGFYTAWSYPDTPGGFYCWDSFLRVEDCPLETDPDPGYFSSHQYGMVGGGTGYVGLQPLGADSVEDPRMLLWSVWDSPVPAVAEYSVLTGTPHVGFGPVVPGLFGGEGVGATIRVQNAWKREKKYRMRLYDAGDIDGDGGKWFRLYFAELNSDGSVNWEVQIGRQKNPPGVGRISSGGSTCFFEPYGGQYDSALDFPYYSAVWSRPVGNPIEASPIPANGCDSWMWGLGDTWGVGRFERCGGGATPDIRHEFGVPRI